jgi:hypothetical protein
MVSLCSQVSENGREISARYLAANVRVNVYYLAQRDPAEKPSKNRLNWL